MSTAPRRVAIIQARMSSSRYPGKVLAGLGGLPMIVFMVQRVRASRLLDGLLVATSTDRSDDALANTLAEYGIECFRGHLNDVLDRYTQAARSLGAEHVVRAPLVVVVPHRADDLGRTSGRPGLRRLAG